MLWVDFTILAVLGIGGWLGYRRGFVAVAIDLAGFIMAAVAAGFTYTTVGSFLGSKLSIVPSLAAVFAFLLILLVVEIAYILAVHRHVHRLPRKLIAAPLNRWAGVGLNLVRMVFILTIALVVFSALPFTSGQKEVVTKAGLAKVMLRYSGQLQQGINSLLGNAVTDTLNFVTVKPESHESIKLGFTTKTVSTDEGAETIMLKLVNEERTRRGLKTLKINLAAREVARSHSRDMFAQGYFSHIDLDGNDPFQRMKEGGIHFRAAGENLALAPTLQLAHNGLMNSPGHRANILSAEFGTVGIGIIDGGRFGLMVTQNFTN